MRVELGPAKAINEAVERWRQKSIFETVEGDNAFTIRKLVWDALKGYLDSSRMLLISPDSDLSRMPFGALPGKEPGSFLIEDYAIGVVPAPRMLTEMASHAAASGDSLLMVGNIDYDAGVAADETSDSGLLHFDRLKSASDEMRAMRGLFSARFPQGKLTLLEQSAATEAAMRRQGAELPVAVCGDAWIQCAANCSVGFVGPG